MQMLHCFYLLQQLLLLMVDEISKMYQYGWYSLDLHLDVFGFVSTLAGIDPPPSCVALLASATMPNESSLKV